MTCAMLCALSGCSAWSGGAAGAPGRSASSAAASEPLPQGRFAFRYPDAAPVLDASGLRALVDRYRHRVVVLHFWAAWSKRSQQELAVLAALREQFAEEDLQVIACNLDPAERWDSDTVPALKAAGANYPCVVLPAEAKADVRAWLAADWSYDLPARFVIDGQGRTAGRWFSGDSTAGMEEHARRLVGGSSRPGELSGLSDRGAALRVKLIDVRRGRRQSLPELVLDRADARRLAEQAAHQVAGELDRRLNARIAVLPFMSSRDRSRAGPFGRQAAERTVESLRERGYYDLIGPAQTEQMLQRAGLTALAVDFDPSLAQDRLPCEYLVLGWLRGHVEEQAGKRVVAGERESE